MKDEYTLEEMLAAESLGSRKRVEEKCEKIHMDYVLTRLLEDLTLSQTEPASATGAAHPTATKSETQNMRAGPLALKKHIEALGGKLPLQVQMPAGESRTYPI